MKTKFGRWRQVQAYGHMKTGLATVLAAMLVLPSAAILLAFYIFARSTISDEATRLLELSLHQKTAYLAQWLDDVENDVWAFASVPGFLQLVENDSDPVSWEAAERGLKARFDEIMRIYADCYLEFRVYDTSGFQVYPRKPGEAARRDTVVLAALSAGKTVIINRAPDSSTVPLSLCLYAPIGKPDNPWLGVLAAHLNPQMIVEHFEDPMLSSSGKAYLVDVQHKTVTPLRSPPEMVSEGGLLSEGVTLALSGESGVKRYRDSRGVPVIGAYTYLPSPGWGLVIEQDYDEAFAGLHRMRRNIFLILGFLAVSCIAFSMFAANRIVRHLEHRDRRIAERSEQLIAADKLATAGVLAASVAHEVNNPLTTINVLIHNLYEEMPSDQPQRMDLNIALDEIAKIKKIILRFLEFARPQEPEFSEVDINQLLQRFCQLMRHQAAAKNIEIVEHMADDLPTVVADPSQIGHVFLNIILNAIEATPVEGRIELSTAYAVGEPVSVRIFNTGAQLDPEFYEKIFEPFYSTKAQGTGLGLSIARMIIERHGGKVTVTTVPGKGTMFTITIKVDGQGINRG